MRTRLNKLKKKVSRLTDIHTLDVAKKSFYSALVKGFGFLFTLLLSIFLGRNLGSDGLGIINLANKISVILIIFAVFGMRQVIIKEVSIAKSRNNADRVKDVIQSAFRFNGAISLVITAVVIGLSNQITVFGFKEPLLRYPLIIIVSVITAQVFSRIFSSGLIGYGKIWQSNLVDQALSVTVTLVYLQVIKWLGFEINLISVSIGYIIGRLIVTAFVVAYWRKVSGIRGKGKNVTGELITPAKSFFLVSLSNAIAASADIVILGLFLEARDVGLYSVGAQLGLVTAFLLQVVNSSISPKIAAMYSNNKLIEMKLMVQNTTTILIGIGLGVLLLFIVGGKLILGLWGSDFVHAYPVLIILSIGQFFNISTGSTGLILMMCGKEKVLSRVKLIEMLLNVTLNILFISLWGILGAAIATASTVALLNATKYVLVVRYFKINAIKLFER